MGRIAAVVLAAGASNRFGAENKLLARIGGRPVVRRVAEAAVGGGAADVVVVTGCDRPLIEEALSGLAVRFAHNANWQAGMGSSIAVGVAALGEDSEGALIVPGDMPLLTSLLIASLAAAFERGGRASIIYPATPSGEQRNPVLWPRRLFPKLMALSGREGAKRLLESLGREAVSLTAEEAALADIDTLADLETARAYLGSAPD
jgi:molybdenum cofactor cytidylyltransferase